MDTASARLRGEIQRIAMEPTIVVCGGCASEFQPSARQLKRHRSRIHGVMTCGSPACRPKVTLASRKTCDECSVEFVGPPAKVTCSDVCKRARVRRQLIDRGVLKKCKRCGNPRVACGGCQLSEDERARRDRLRRRRYYDDNKERITAWQRSYNAANAETIKVRNAEYYRERSDSIKEKAAQYYEENKQRISEMNRRWALAHPDAVRKAARKHNLDAKYGMSIQEWDEMFEAQGRRCAVCEGESPRHAYGWHTDHDHETGRVRGILCSPCNMQLGQLGDCAEGVIATANAFLRYLEKPSSDSNSSGARAA